MTDYDTLRGTADKTPLVDLLRAIPKDYRAEWTEAEGLRATHLSPVGLYCHEAAEAITHLQAKVERLEGALRPFADAADLAADRLLGWEADALPDDSRIRFALNVTLGHIRAARQALSDEADHAD